MGMTGVERQRRYKIRKYEWAKENLPWVQCACGCGESLPPLNTNLKPSTYAHGHNAAGIEHRFKPGPMSAERKARLNPARGAQHHHWRGGEWRLNSGYWRVTVSDVEAAQMPTAIKHGGGWSLPRSHHVWNLANPDDPVVPGEVIHHIDHVRDHDVIENFQKLTASEHYALHFAERAPMEHGPDGRFLPRK